MDSLFDECFNDNNNNPGIFQSNLTKNITNDYQNNLKPSENINQIYKSKMEASKDKYDIAIKPMKKPEQQKSLQNTSEPKTKPKSPEPIFSNAIQIEEESQFEKPLEKKIFKQETLASFKTAENLSRTKPSQIIEEPPIIHEQGIEQPIQMQQEPESVIRENVPEKMSIENEKWNDINANSEALLNGSSEMSKDFNDILDEDGNILFYYYDAWEDTMSYPGIVFLFGKVNQLFNNLMYLLKFSIRFFIKISKTMKVVV